MADDREEREAVPPLLGRVFSRQDDQAGSAPAVILNHGYWQTKLGGDPGVLGKRITIDGEAREVIGVMPRHFRFLDVKSALILPINSTAPRSSSGNSAISRGPASSSPTAAPGALLFGVGAADPAT